MKSFGSSSLLLVLIMACALTIHGQSNPRAKRSQLGGKTKAAKSNTQSNPAFEKAVQVGDAARIAGRLDEAIESYTNALRIQRQWPEGWWYLGAIFYQKDLYPQARDAFSTLVGLEPKRGPAWAMLGLCQFQTREYDRAIASFERAYTLGFNGNKELNSVVIYHSALLYARFEEFEIAYDILRQYEGGYDNQKIVEAFGLIMLRMPLLPSEIPANKHEEVLLAGRAGANMAARRIDDGRRAFEELLARYPTDPNAHYSFAVFMLPQDADRALQEFRRAMELDPNHQAAMVQMAFEYLKRREYSTALPLAERSVELAPKMYPARNVFGRLLLEVGQTERAIKELEEGIRLAPGSPEMHFALARAYSRAGRRQDAERETDIFKKLQEKYNQPTAAPQTEGAITTKSAKPNPEEKNQL